MNRPFAVILLSLLFSYSARCQPGSYIQYTTANGLLSNTLYDIVQDQQGFIWISSNSGVYRFDGTSFRNFGIVDGLPDNVVLKLFMDSYGRIWFFCFNGRIGYYQDGKFRNLFNDSILAGIRLKNIPITFYEGNDSQLHILVQNGNYIRLRINAAGIVSSKVVHAPATCYWEEGTDGYHLDKYSIAKNGKEIYRISPSLASRSWIYAYARGNTLYYPGRKGIYTFRNDSFQLFFPAASIRYLIGNFYLKNENELFTFSNVDGVICWRKVAGRFVPVDEYPDPKNGGKMLVDRQGGIWITTLTQGLYYYPLANRSWRTVAVRGSWPGKNVTEMQLIDSDRIIMGFENGNVAIFDKNFGLQKTYRIAGESQYMPVRDIRVVSGKIIVSGGNTFLFKQHGQGIVSGSFKDIETDGQRIYFVTATEMGYLDPVTGRTHLITPEGDKGVGTRKYAVWPAAGRLWYSNIEGLQLLEQDKKVPLPGKRHPFLQKRIVDIREIGKGFLVLVSDGSGVALADKEGTVLQVLSGKDLRYGLIQKAVVDNDQLWLAGTAGIGIFRFTGSKLQPEYWIDKNNGLQSNDVCACCFDKQFLYVSTRTGLQKLDRAALLKKTGTPVLFVHALESGGQTWTAYEKEIALPAGCREVRLQCSALAFGNTAQTIFAYRFGSSGSFIESTNPVLSIPVGFEGKETLFLKCRKGDSEWSETALLHLDIPVPFHKRTVVILLFLIVASLTASGLSVYFVNRLRKRQMNLKDLKLQVAQLEIRALQSSMNPHFVFNALNAVQHFVNEGDAYEVNKYLTKFSRLLRSNLNNNTASLISLDKELSSLRDYLELEQLRFGQKLQFTISVDQYVRAEDTLIPAMLVQPLVENAILHGILGIDYAGQIDIDIAAEGNHLLIRVRDNGTGLVSRPEQDGEHRSLGIQTIQNRLALLNEINKGGYAFHLANNTGAFAGKGATALLVLPLAMR